MTLDDSIPCPGHQGGHASRLRVMARAQEMGNVTRACRESGISRSLFYRRWKRYLAYGRDGLHPRRQGPHRGLPQLLSVRAERAILALALTLAWPTWGPA